MALQRWRETINTGETVSLLGVFAIRFDGLRGNQPWRYGDVSPDVLSSLK